MTTTTSFAPYTNPSHFLFAALEEVTNHGSNNVSNLMDSEDNVPLLESHELTGLRGATMLKNFVGSPDTPNYGWWKRAPATNQGLVSIVSRLHFLEQSSLLRLPAMESGDLRNIDVTMMLSSILANLTLPALTALTLRDISVDTVLLPIAHPRSAVREMTIASDEIVEADFIRLLNELSAVDVVAVLIEFAHTTAFIHRLFEISGCFTVLCMLTPKGVEAVDLSSMVHAKDVRTLASLQWDDHSPESSKGW
ncbi:hypothetical protein ARMGADRAFT_1037059 [Armillaria gallica]|uniref:Uncharacterized protein n=1 Tax=Armillaria gallica TaxID=47427 RepID=A0A2H3CZG1_ARMGA|nr:hypothetical protein ARMGADRAFT_1037059 [Armillaria gallica]